MRGTGNGRGKVLRFEDYQTALLQERSGSVAYSYILRRRVGQPAIVGDHKLILYPKAKKARLFNLARDPDEMKDLAEEPDSKPLMKKLFARLLELQRETGDTLDLKGPFAELVGG